MTLRLAVFDCDGTLCDGQAAVCEAMEAAFAARGLTAPERSAVRRIVGLSLPQAIGHLAPDAESELLDALVEAYKRAFRQSRLDGTLHEPLFDGIADLVAGLSASGWMLGIATGKSGRGLSSTLATHGLSAHFFTLQTADRHPSKPHPSMLEAAMAEAMATPDTTVMIGDTAYDMEMARACGVRALGVGWGYHTAEELRAAGAEQVAATAAELREMLNG